MIYNLISDSVVFSVLKSSQLSHRLEVKKKNLLKIVEFVGATFPLHLYRQVPIFFFFKDKNTEKNEICTGQIVKGMSEASISNKMYAHYYRETYTYITYYNTIFDRSILILYRFKSNQ